MKIKEFLQQNLLAFYRVDSLLLSLNQKRNTFVNAKKEIRAFHSQVLLLILMKVLQSPVCITLTQTFFTALIFIFTSKQQR